MMDFKGILTTAKHHAASQLARCLFLSNAAQTYSPCINLLVSVTGSQKLTFVTRSQFLSNDCSLQIMEPC